MRYTFIAAGVVSVLCFSCSPKIVESVRTEIKTEYRDSIAWRDTTIYISLPDEHSANHLQLSDTSHLETSLAVSTAWVDSSGLHHSLANKRGEWGVKLAYPTRTITAKAEASRSDVIERKVYIERQLTRWQQFRLRWFWVLLAALIASLVWIFRQPLSRVLLHFLQRK